MPSFYNFWNIKTGKFILKRICNAEFIISRYLVGFFKSHFWTLVLGEATGTWEGGRASGDIYPVFRRNDHPVARLFLRKSAMDLQVISFDRKKF